MKTKTILLSLLLLFVGSLFAVSHSMIVSQSDLAFSVNAEKFDVVNISEYDNTDVVGAPQLPVCYLNFIIPAGNDVSSIQLSTTADILKGDYYITPAQPAEDWLSGPFVDPDPNIYKEDAWYPQEVVEVVHQDYLDGANRIVTVAVHPLQYWPTKRQLKLHTSLSFSFNYTTSQDPIIYPVCKTERGAAIAQRLLEGIVANPQDISTYANNPNLPSNCDCIDIVIVGPNELLPCFAEYMEWTRLKGYRVETKSIEAIVAEYPNGDQVIPGGLGIADDAGSVRQYLRDQYAGHGLNYALLVGDETNFPIRYGNAWDNNPEEVRNMPTDLYFADFTGDWNVDGSELDGTYFYGERNGDDVDYHREIFVGRLLIPPVAEGGATEIANWTEKVIGYEYNPGYGDTNYLTNAYFEQADNAAGDPQDVFNILEANGFMTHFTVENPINGSIGTPTGAQVINELSQGYGFSSFYAHGSKECVSVANLNINDTVRYAVTSLDCYNSFYGHIVEDGNGFDNLPMDGRYFIYHSVSCHNGSFDTQETGVGSTICMARAFTSYLEKQCGPACIANTRYGYGHDLQKKFFENLFHFQEPKIGFTMALRYSHYCNLFQNLFGNPELSIWTTSTPAELQVAYGNNNTVTVTTNGTPVADAWVAFRNTVTNEEQSVLTNASGNASCSFAFNRIGVSKHNHIPYIRRVALNNENITNTKLTLRFVGVARAYCLFGR